MKVVGVPLQCGLGFGTGVRKQVGLPAAVTGVVDAKG